MNRAGLNNGAKNQLHHHASLLKEIFFVMLLLIAWAGQDSGSARAEKFSDTTIAIAIETNLSHDLSIPERMIDVEVQDGIATLSGSVPNLLIKERAAKISQSIKGVRSVVNTLTLSSPGMINDDTIQKDVIMALAADPATEAHQIKVNSDSGVVTLSGTVESWQERSLAAETAKRVKGVKAVTNHIQFEAVPGRPDSEIRDDVIRLLESDVWVADHLIEVTVQQSKVTLSGIVGSAAEKAQATADAWVTGVRAVDPSRLQVNWWAKNEQKKTRKFSERSDEEILKSLRLAFSHDPRVSRFDIALHVKKGFVTLRGIVPTFKSKKAAERDARLTTGVIGVNNLLKVRPKDKISDGTILQSVNRTLANDPILDKYKFTVRVWEGSLFLSGHVDSEFEKSYTEEILSGIPGIHSVVNNLATGVLWLEEFDEEIQEKIKAKLEASPFFDDTAITVTVEEGIATYTGTVNFWLQYSLAKKFAIESGAKSVRNRLRLRFQPEAIGSNQHPYIERSHFS